METNNGVIHYKSRSDYLSRKPSVSDAAKTTSRDSAKTLKDSAPSSDASKVNISEEAKSKSLSQKANKGEHDKISNKEKLKRAGNHLLQDAASTLLKNVSPKIPLGIPSPGLDIQNRELIENGEKPIAPIDRPAVIFISGLDLNGISSGGGLKSMSDKINGSEHYSWQDEDQVLKDILQRPSYQPVILIGHSLGGDSAVNIANKLNTLESGFRKVDLLVTLDSVGFDNDIIPQNVRSNLNYIGDKDVLFNDGPNVARDSDFTDVVNELRGEDHVGIDDSREVQFKIYTSIKNVLKAEELRRKFETNEARRGAIGNF